MRSKTHESVPDPRRPAAPLAGGGEQVASRTAAYPIEGVRAVRKTWRNDLGRCSRLPPSHSRSPLGPGGVEKDGLGWVGYTGRGSSFRGFANDGVFLSPAMSCA
ncbi:unnamed protein product, partial [Scytosiphon promiscuus]